MPNKMLIDATHPEETRVVVLHGNRVEEFDFESANRKQLRGNIYLAKVTRVEPSLQAAFVDYGGNRHGFLAFSEIHPDYYQIPVADRQALIAEEERAQREAEEDHERGRGGRNRRHRSRSRGSNRNRNRDRVQSDPVAGEAAAEGAAPETADALTDAPASDVNENADALTAAEAASTAEAAPAGDEAREDTARAAEAAAPESDADRHDDENEHSDDEHADEHAEDDGDDDAAEGEDEAGEGEAAAAPVDEHVESVGGADALEEVQERVARVRPRQYKIQEVIKRRQILLVQVVKEERGTKGAALTTYLSLAGRYSVLMPNTARGGGISRKITSSEDRSRLKEIAQDLEVPEGMGVILRTAGASRTKTEVKRDFEYLIRLWETVRDLTLKSTAPTLVYEEGSLTKRSIRDLYNKDIEEIVVSGDQGYKDAKEFMRMLMPSHAKNVKLYRDSQPIFTRYNIESQLDAMFSPVVQLRSGGYIVINQAEALVAIDVNSGRATREHHIEDTAHKTNLEAAEEIARQLRLRDLAGLIVIDFIDMDEGRNNRAVERKMKECLRHDRARIQVGRISHFGLLEMSRQRIRTSVLESSTEKCPHCGGTGYVRSVSSVALQLLRGLEETLIKGATHSLIARTRSDVALYVLNNKRAHLRRLEERFQITITVSADATVIAPQSFIVERGEQVHTPEQAREIAAAQPEPFISTVEDDELDAALAAEHAEEEEHEHTHHRHERGDAEGHAEHADAEGGEDGGESQDGGPRRRRRRRGRGRGGRGGEPREANGQQGESLADANGNVAEPEAGDDSDSGEAEGGEQQQLGEGADRDGSRRRRRRGRRGGRRNRHRNDDGNGENNATPAGESAEGGSEFAPEPHAEAVQSAPPPMQERQPARPQPQQDTPSPAPSAADAEAPRRRSTVREAAPVASASTPSSYAPAPAEAPKPVVSSTSEDPAQPKRGWWGKRILGDKG